MDRKKFIRNGLFGLGSIVSLSTFFGIKAKSEAVRNEACELAPSETAGPFPIKSPAQLVRENIIGNRSGIPLEITLAIRDQSSNCEPLSGVLVDVWHCDAHGHYSQYGGMRMQRSDFTNENFLRGRQATDANGQVSFVSIFPGWYPGRAPHIHVEVLDANERSIRVTQIAFPEDVCESVYASSSYRGSANVSNERDGVFRGSLEKNMLDEISGNLSDGYTLRKTIIV
jgi:protocatechuate 3,4-dioxygenase beta subunit